MRLVIPINRDWFYKSDYNEKDILERISEKYQKVTLPHTNVELPYNYFDDKIFCFVSCYKRVLHIKREWKGKRFFLDFEGVMNYAQVFVNAELAGEHKGGYTAFSIEITKFVNFNDENEITVVVDSTERADTPPFGGQIDYLTYGGIYREVCLRLTDKEYIKDAFVQTKNVLKDQKTLIVDATLDGIEDANDYEICVTLVDNEKEIAACKEQLNHENAARIQLDNLFDSPDGVLKDNENADNPSKYLLYQDPLVGIFDGQIKGMMLDKYYLEVCSKLADIELMDNTMDDIFAYYKELAGVLVNKSMLGVKMREAYRKKDKAELELLRDTMEECAKKMWNLKELRKSIWFRECKPFGYEVLDIRYGGVYVRLMSSIQRIDAFLKGTIDKIDELEEETVKYNEDQKYPEHTHCMGGFWQNMVSAANISGI